MTFKKSVPTDRTIVDGVWSDILDDWSASFVRSDRGVDGLGVFVADQTSGALSIPFLTGRVNFTLASTTTRGSRFFDAVAGHGIIVGDVIELSNNDEFMQAKVLGVVTNQIELDSQINHAYITTDTAIKSKDSLLVNGSVTPVVFSILPTIVQKGDFTKIIIVIESTTSMDFTTFGSKDPLTNGCLVRVKKSNGDFRNLFNFKTNSDFIENSFSHFFQEKVGGGGFGFTSESTFGGQQNRGVVIRLEGSESEELQVVVQDNLTTGLIKLKMLAQGHEVSTGL